MELTVKRSGMPCCENVFAYLMPAEEAVETVVPDTMPDVERILFTEGIASIRSKEVLDGAVNITGSVNATVLYVPEGGEGTSSLEATIPLSVELDAPDVTSDSLAVALLTVVSMDSRLLNPRKILVRAVVNVFVLAFNRTELGISSGLEGEGADSVETLSETSSLSPVVCVREKTFVVSDEYTLQPGLLPIGELLWHSTQIIPGNVRSVGARIIFNGTVRLNIIYSAAGSGELSTAAFESEFSQMLDAETDLTSPDCDVYSMLTAEYVEPVTLAGGERGISAEYHIVSQCVCTDSVRVECLTDCYSNTHLLDVGRTQTELNAAQRRSTVRASASETIPASPAPVNIVRVMCRAGRAESEPRPVRPDKLGGRYGSGGERGAALGHRHPRGGGRYALDAGQALSLHRRPDKGPQQPGRGSQYIRQGAADTQGGKIIEFYQIQRVTPSGFFCCNAVQKVLK